jgi:maltooligosyltrehalose trehalohydrolase
MRRSDDDSEVFEVVADDAGEGTRYRFRIDGRVVPDPVSRFQPEGPMGPSEVIDPSRFVWSDQGWAGVAMPGQVICELHFGTFTPEGTFEAAARQLPALAEAGYTCLELMPVAEFTGLRGWSYDGVGLFAPYHGYGRPDDLRRFVDAAHRLGLAVILDVVYNHLGPEGCTLAQVTPYYFHESETTEWGQALNFDGPHSNGVRAFYLANAEMWIGEFHMDGLRLDASHEIRDRSTPHVLTEMAQAVHETAMSLGRRAIVLAENEPQNAMLVRAVAEGGHGLDAIWSEDFHHVAMVALLGRREGYFSDYHGSPQEFVSLFKRGFLYQGQWNARQGKRRGSSTDGLRPWQFVNYLENHDQVANWLGGRRLPDRSAPDLLRAITAVFLLAPQTPMLFMGQDYGSTRRFHYFSDLSPELSASIAEGRVEFMSQFPSATHPSVISKLEDPRALSTFLDSKLCPDDRREDAPLSRLHRDLIHLRRTDRVISQQGRNGLDGAVLGDRAFVIRYEDPDGDDRLLVLNLGNDLELRPVTEPLLAPREGCDWELLWSSENVVYGGSGLAPPIGPAGWWLTAHSTLVFVTNACGRRP